MAETLLFAGSIMNAVRMKDENSAYLAGGTEINRLGSSVQAQTLIGIGKIDELKKIRKDDDLLWVGAAVTFQEALDCAEIPEWFKTACRMMASRTKRNRATIGGNIALMRDDSYILPALMAAEASLIYVGQDNLETETSLCDYIEKRQEGKLSDVLILWIGLPLNKKVLSKRYANTAMSHSVLNISLAADGNKIAIASAVKNSGLYRMNCLENLISGDPTVSETTILETVRGCKSLNVTSDTYGSEAYKRYLLGVTIAQMAAEIR